MLIWDARKISDKAYHRRRLVIACFALVGGLMLLAGSGMGLLDALSFRDAFGAAGAFVFLAYFGRMALHEYGEMKTSS